MKVCILAAGLGSRLGSVSDHIHKALLPLGNEAVLSHIFKSFPDASEFVIATGNRAEQVEAFVEIAHPELKVTFVRVDPYKGPGSGPGISLLACRRELQEPFVFTACDTLISTALPTCDANWMGVAPVDDPQNWCTTIVDAKMRISSLEYKEPGSTAKYAFTGIAFVKDYEEFWASYDRPVNKAKEIQVNDGLEGLIPRGLEARAVSWSDTGNWESYEKLVRQFDKNFTFLGKTTEFTYRYGDRVIKVYDEPQKASNCHARGLALAGSVPPMRGCKSSVLAYSFAEGDLLSSHLDGNETTNFLGWLQATFWKSAQVDAAKFRETLRKFYIEKTNGRLDLLMKKHADLANIFNDPLVINGVTCQPAHVLMKQNEARILEGGLPSVFHGDLHANNVIKTRDGYTLIDWRDDFGGQPFGDRYYDLAKFLHTFDLSVKTMDAGDFHVQRPDERAAERVTIDHVCSYRDMDGRDAFWEFLKKHDYDRHRCELINAVIFLNMAPLYDRAMGMYLYYLGRYQLQRLTR